MPWATRSALPDGKFDRGVELAEPPNTANFKAWVKLWPGARHYMLKLTDFFIRAAKARRIL